MLHRTYPGLRLVIIALSALLLSACTERLAPAPTRPTATVPAQTALRPADLARGQQVYLDKQCAACHNSSGTGGIGKSLAGTTLSFDDFLHVLRTAVPPKPAFNETELLTQDAFNIYGWLKSLKRSDAALPAPTRALGAGQELGMTLWVKARCDACHGAFAQGSPKGPALAGINEVFEVERDRMRRSAGTISGHADQAIDDALFRRLYQWLKEGADPASGC